jgi:hypothetical protein
MAKRAIEARLTKLEAKAPEGNGVFLVLCRQPGESLEDFDRRAERETREAKQKAGSEKSFILRINGVEPRQGSNETEYRGTAREARV